MIGQQIDRKYEATKLIGEGAMGAVYEARHLGTGRMVAVKVITDAAAESDTLVARFEREAKAAAKVLTPHIVEILGTGRDPKSGNPYIVMELLEGQNVQQLVARVGPLAPQLAARIGVQVCMGLDKAHSGGVVHRDIKPANLFLTAGDGDERIVKLLDFGVAKLKMDHASSTGNESLTRTGSVVGSPIYMSPEQARGLKSIDHRADLWSLGMVLCELLTGQPLRPGIQGLGELIIAICAEEPPSVLEQAPWVPTELADAISGALRLAASERYQSAAEMLERLQRCVGGSLRIDERMLVPLTEGDKGGAADDDEPATRVMGAEVEIDLAPAIVGGSGGSAGDDVAPVEGIGDAAEAARLETGSPLAATTTSSSPPTEGPTLRSAAALANSSPPDLPATAVAAAPRGRSWLRVLLAVGAGIVLGTLVVGAINWIAPPQPAAAASAPATAVAADPVATEAAQTSDPGAGDSAPVASAESTATSSAEGEQRTVKVTVFPPFAGVAVDGERSPPKGGIIEITGPVGSHHDVVVTVGGRHTTARIRITEQGPVPAKIVFQAAGGGRAPAAQPEYIDDPYD